MGRHSAPDDGSDELEESSGAAVLTVEDSPTRGRHAIHGSDSDSDSGPDSVGAVAEAPTQIIDASLLVDTGPVVERADGSAAASDTVSRSAPAEPDVPAAPPSPARAHATALDLALLRSHSDVRNRCIAGLLVPFVVYVVVMVVLGAHGSQYALWIFIPLITAGVLVGALLDAAHRKYDNPSG